MGPTDILCVKRQVVFPDQQCVPTGNAGFIRGGRAALPPEALQGRTAPCTPSAHTALLNSFLFYRVHVAKPLSPSVIPAQDLGLGKDAGVRAHWLAAMILVSLDDLLFLGVLLSIAHHGALGAAVCLSPQFTLFSLAAAWRTRRCPCARDRIK